MAVDLVQLNSDIQENFKDHWIYDYVINEDKTITPLNEWSYNNVVLLAKSLFKGKDVMVCDARSGLTCILLALNGSNHIHAYEAKDTDASIIRRAVEFLGLQDKITIYEQNALLIEQGELFVDQECIDSVDYMFSLATMQWKYFNSILAFEGLVKAAHLYAKDGVVTDFPKSPNSPDMFTEERYIQDLEKYFNIVVGTSGFFVATSKKTL
jgi:hypothetical protein